MAGRGRHDRRFGTEVPGFRGFGAEMAIMNPNRRLRQVRPRPSANQSSGLGVPF
jgi:hypothetical protein